MPTQVFECPRHGEFDIFLHFSQDVPQEADCPVVSHGRNCCEISRHVLKAPAGILIKNTWNDNANKMRRDPYTQAKYQAQHMQDEQRDQGNYDIPNIGEAGLQVAAARIDADNKGKIKRTSPEERAKQGALRTARKNKEKRNL